MDLNQEEVLGRYKTKTKAPAHYWQDKALETAKLLGVARTRFFRDFMNLSNADADFHYNKAKEFAENPGSKKPIALYLDWMKDKAKYARPFQK